MDPIKEKLNLLKKLAHEKKITNIQQNNQKRHKLSNINESKSSPSNKQNETSTNIILTEIDPIELEFDDEEEINNLMNENNKKPFTDDGLKTETTDRNFLRAQSQADSRNRSTSIDNSNINTAQLFSDNYNNLKYGLNSKPMQKSLTVNQEPSTFKYINRIRDFYDRERASSTDAINLTDISKTNKYGSSFLGIKNNQLKKFTTKFDSNQQLEQPGIFKNIF